MSSLRRGWTRREFLKASTASGAAALWPALWFPSHGVAPRSSPPGPALAAGSTQEPLRVGYIAHGPASRAEAVRAAALGAEFGAAEAAHLARLLGRRFELVSATAPDGDGIFREAQRLVESEAIFALVGGLDEESCQALSEFSERQEIPFLNIGCAEDALRGERCGPYAFHVAASTAMYTDALAEWLVTQAGLKRWCLVAPETAAGEVRLQRARSALLERGAEATAQVGVPTERPRYRELVGELARKEPDVVFLLLAGDGLAAFLRAYRERRARFEVATPFAHDGPPWTEPVEIRIGVRPAMWHHRLFRFGAEQLSDRFSDRFGRPLESLGWASWLAMKILAETALRARTVDPGHLVRTLESDRAQFDGHKGRPLSFRSWDHQLRQPVYLIRPKPEPLPPWDLFDVVGEVPRGAPREAETSRDFLDRIGDLETETRCRLARP